MKKAGREARKTPCARRPWNPTLFATCAKKDGAVGKVGIDTLSPAFPQCHMKLNPHCPVRGCKTVTPHAADPFTKQLIQEFGPPARMVTWALAAMTELMESICRDLIEKKVLAWYTRLRQPEEIYVTALYAIFIADEKELHHDL